MEIIKEKPQKKENYVSNKDFSEAVVAYVKSATEAKAAHKPVPTITEYIGTCFLKIANGLGKRPNFSRYTYRDEMVMDAVENCIKAIENYNVEAATRSGKPNAFAYFTQICWYAFLRRMAREKRQQEIKEKYIEFCGCDSLSGWQGDENDLTSQNIIERIRSKAERLHERDEKVKEFGKKIKEKRKSSSEPEGIEFFFA